MQTNVSVTADPAAETTMKKRNTLTIGDQLKSYARHPGAGILAFLTLLGAVITFAPVSYTHLTLPTKRIV